MLKKLTLLFIFFPLGVYPQIQAQTVEGRVFDEATQEALEGATILESGTVNGTSAGENGAFSIELISDSNELTISFVGYHTVNV